MIIYKIHKVLYPYYNQTLVQSYYHVFLFPLRRDSSGGRKRRISQVHCSADNRPIWALNEPRSNHNGDFSNKSGDIIS